MGSLEESASPKPNKSASSTQEAQTTPMYPDWSSSVQAYHGAGVGAPPFFASTVVSPSLYPYMWGGQHPLIPPYGTPIPYPAIYPLGGVYAHPTMAATASASAKIGEGGKATSGTGNDGRSQSAEGSIEAIDETKKRQETTTSKRGSFVQMLFDGANTQNSVTGTVVPVSAPAMPLNNLKIGMDLWSTTADASGSTMLRPNPTIGVAPRAITQEQWIPNERELKREKRKQSNRESARRSKLRKQEQLEELQRRVETLTDENNALKEELQRLREECKKPE